MSVSSPSALAALPAPPALPALPALILLDLERHPLFRRGRVRKYSARVGFDAGQIAIGSSRFVMKQKESFGPATRGKFGDLTPTRVAPASVAR